MASGGVRRGDVVLDCGAYVGTTARQALRAGASLVIALEPMPQARECLQRNLREEIGAGRVIVLAIALWDQQRILTFELARENPSGSRVIPDSSGAAQTLEVQATTIDQLVTQLKLERVDFIKMDIEGAESRALLGAQGALHRWRPRMAIAAYHQAHDAEEITATARRAVPGYAVNSRYCLVRDRWTGPLTPQVVLFS